MQLFSLSNSFLTFLVIVSLILNSFGFLNTHNEPVSQINEPPDPFEMLMGEPSPILESAPDFEELQKQINSSEELEKVYPQIKLDLNPALIIPGEPFLVSWELKGTEELEKLTTSDAYLSINPSNAVQLSADQILPSQLEILAKDDGSTQLKTVIQNISGQISWNLDTQKVQDNEQQYLALYLMDGENNLISQAVALKPVTHLISKDFGGTITSFDERVIVNIPTEALDENVYMDISFPSPHTNPSYSLTGNAIEILAVGEKSKQNLHQFSSDLTIQMKYNEEDLKRWSAEDLTIYYFSEEDKDWYPLPTTVDTKTRTLTAKVDHLTIFDYKASSWQASRIPSVEEFQVADFTGAATYAVNFWVPPAPGGLEPKLSLQYNSQVIDDSVVFTQASWVGMGWSLDTGAIERNMHGTTANLDDDTFEFMLNGFSSRLLPISTNGSVITYATIEQSFWTITFNTQTNIWEAWDQQGKYYKFNHTAKTHTTQTCTSSASNLNLTWRWSLTEVRDKYNNTLTYTYTTQPKSTSCANVVAVYPTTIVWPNNRYRAQFILEDRLDYQSSWEQTASRINFSNKRLDKINIQHSENGTSWTSIRQFDLTYSTTSANIIYPDFTWTKGSRTSTLSGLQEKSGDGSSSLPATEFLYADKMHLTKVKNGYGGEVTINYSRWTYLDDDNDDLRSLYISFGTGSTDQCSPYYPGTTWSVYNGYGSVKCEANMLQLDKRTSTVAIAQHQFPEFIIKPGGQYRVAVLARSISGSTSLEYGFRNGLAGNDIQGSCTLTTTMSDCETGLEMPVIFDPNNTILLLESPWAYIKRVQYLLMPFYYRVTSRVVSDTNTNLSLTYAYSYDGATSNTAEFSENVAAVGSNPSLLYTPSFREYRGNAITRVKNPDGMTTTNWYHQSDTQKGRIYRSLVVYRQSFDYFDQINTSNWTYSHPNTQQTITSSPFYNDNMLKSVNSQANWNVVVRKSTYSITDGEVIYAQFRVEGDNTQAETGIEKSNGDFFGIVASKNGGIKVRKVMNGVTTDSPIMISSTDFKLNCWYMLMIFVDGDDGFHLRVWEQTNPAKYNEQTSFDYNLSSAFRLRQRVYNGTAYLDYYQEGIPYAETEYKYDPVIIRDSKNNDIQDIASPSLVTSFEDLQISWSPLVEQISRTYNGDFSFSATKTTYQYVTTDQGGTQCGQPTRTTEYEWDGSGWQAYRASKTQFWPNSSAHLTALPARTITLDCQTSGCDFNNETVLTSETLFLYDGSHTYNTAPTTGILTAQRTRVEVNDYVQTSFTYDTYGNLTGTTVYQQYATLTANPTGNSFTYSNIYDTNYHTYVVEETNPLGHTQTYIYNYTYGVPTSVTDANNVTTLAYYDVFRRMTKIVAPGDSVQSPTLQAAYYDTSQPWHVDLNQKVDNDASIRVSHFYDGLGREIQTQQVGKYVGDSQFTIVSDVSFDAMGRQSKQSVPYTITYNSTPAFQTQNFSQHPYTQTTYDLFGRLYTSTAPNGNQSTYTYGDNTITVTDPNGNPTTSWMDVWGRTVKVQAAESPTILFTYDTHDRLVQVQEGEPNGYLTQILYNFAGQKRSLTTPDMGTWSYEYDPLGNLSAQTDARGCTIDMLYDELNRLIEKSYDGPDACAQTATVHYYYDSYLDFPQYIPVSSYPVGQRTGMTDGSGQTIWEYNNRGLTSLETKTIASQTFSTAWTYNSADQVVTITYPDGEVVSNGYDPGGDLDVVKNDQNFHYLSYLHYDEAGRISEMDFNSSMWQRFEYYDWTTSVTGGLLSSIEATNNNNIGMQQMVYGYDTNGNILSIDDAINAEDSVFSYDDANRLVSMQVESNNQVAYSEVFTYNTSNGNLSARGSDLNQLIPYSYDTTHPHAVDGFNGNSYTYDANGNQIGREIGQDSYELIFDGDNRLVQVLIGEDELPTVTPTATGIPTETTTPSPTATLEPTIQPTVTATPTALQATPSPSITATSIYTPSVTPTATNTPRFVRTIIFETGYPIPSTPTYQIESIPETQEVQQQEEPQMVLSMFQVEQLAEYIYDGDGNLVQSIIAGVVTYYPNQYYEKRVVGVTESILKYYYAAGKRIAMREDGTVTFLLADHLGSTSVTTDSSGVLVSSMLYTAFGETRSTSGITASDYLYTGQREESEIGLYFYNARFYDPALARFISADTIVPQPGDPLSWDRYAYVYNNPIKYNDPSGHWVDTVLDIAFIGYDIYDIKTNGLNWVNGLSLVADIAGTIIPVVTGAGLAVKAIAHADDGVKVINAVDNSLDLAKAFENTTSTVDKIEDLSKAVTMPLENHHFATNKNKNFTPLFEEIVKKFGLDLDGEWNIFKLSHKGRHPNEYHRWVYDEMKKISNSLEQCTSGCSEKFIQMFAEKVITPVKNNPQILRKIFWKAE